MIDKVLAHLDARRDENLRRLQEVVRIPSISTDPTAKPAVNQAAQWVLAQFKACGIPAELCETAGHPAIIADTGPADKKGPVVLVYGHYDVQPTGDLSLWKTGPFEASIREGRLYARGSADDKGQVFTHMLAAEAWKAVAGKLPIRVKFLIEGEEEIGSKNLRPLVEKKREQLACDYVVLSDTAKLSAEVPAITYGTKGLLYKEITYYGAKNDLHSGTFGGSVPNPGNELAGLIARMKDHHNRVAIPGFYDQVAEPSREERALLAALPFDERGYQAEIGAGLLTGEEGWSTIERRWIRPTLDVNGLLCGFTGEGSMTVLPAKAMAKVSMRLVPNQTPEHVSAAFDRFVAAHTPAGIRHEIKEFTSCAAYMCPLDNAGLRTAASAVEAGFGVKPAMIREGGTLPILPMFKKVLGAESIMMGFCLPTCNAHGPNEFMVLDDFYAGARTAAHLFQRFAQ
jgi:acetylornithine deacetylase/succinyl-diaminopimelate desuccinylase-like protein